MDEELASGRDHKPIRVLIADDHPLFRSALRQMLSEQLGFKVVGEAADGQEATELCHRLRPELVLMDLRMPRMDGIAATRQIKQAFPSTVVLILTAFEAQNHLLEALEVGAAGYVLKHATPQELADAVRKALSGESPINHELATQLLRSLADKRSQEKTQLPSEPPNKRQESLPRSLSEALTPRELDVLRLLAVGRTNKQIAQELTISLATVKTHVEHIIAKLRVSDRTQAAIRAIELGLSDKQQH
jgi:DNA-binding NarL/FixJ family response regulator